MVCNSERSTKKAFFDVCIHIKEIQISLIFAITVLGTMNHGNRKVDV